MRDFLLFFIFPMVFTAPLLLGGVPLYFWLRRKAEGHPQAWMHRVPSGLRFWLPLNLALLFAPTAGVLSVIAYGIGHPASQPLYFPKYIFPLAILLALPFHGDSGWVQLYLSAIQVVLYGLLLGICWSRRAWIPLVLLVVIHFLAVMLLFHIRPGREL